MIKKLRKSLILSCVLALLVPSIASADMNVTRISGKDRYETALMVQRKHFTKANRKLAVIACGSDFKTALYGSQMANALKIPFYIMPNAGMSKVMMDELRDKQVKKAFIMGDYSKLNKSINNSLIEIGITPIRYTDKRPSNHVEGFPTQVWYTVHQILFPDTALGDIANMILINDNKFPDLLSAIPFTAELNREWNMVLDGYPDDEFTRGREFVSGYGFIIGGFDSVPSKFITQDDFENPIGLVRHVWKEVDGTEHEYYSGRIAGPDRYKTAVEIAKAYKIVRKKNIRTAVIVDGTKYPDALASGTAATMNDGTILLTKPNKLNEDTKAFIRSNNIKNIIIVGGEKSVSKSVENELKGL